MIEQPYHGEDAVRVWFNYNEIEQDLYRALGYAEVQDLHGNYRKDFNEKLTGDVVILGGELERYGSFDLDSSYMLEQKMRALKAISEERSSGLLNAKR